MWVEDLLGIVPLSTTTVLHKCILKADSGTLHEHDVCGLDSHVCDWRALFFVYLWVMEFDLSVASRGHWPLFMPSALFAMSCFLVLYTQDDLYTLSHVSNTMSYFFPCTSRKHFSRFLSLYIYFLVSSLPALTSNIVCDHHKRYFLSKLFCFSVDKKLKRKMAICKESKAQERMQSMFFKYEPPRLEVLCLSQGSCLCKEVFGQLPI